MLYRGLYVCACVLDSRCIDQTNKKILSVYGFAVCRKSVSTSWVLLIEYLSGYIFHDGYIAFIE